MRRLRYLLYGFLVSAVCSCATCHVFVDPAWAEKLPPRSRAEIELLSDLPTFDDGRSRLSCQIMLSEELDGLVLTVAQAEF